MSQTPVPSALTATADAVRAVVRPPFRTLIMLSILIALTSITFSTDPNEIEIALSILLLIASIYIQIAIVLAAGRSEPEPSADAWIRGAFVRRCFWRFVGTSLVVVLGLAAGALLLVVGIFVVGALLALAPSAAVLERRVPMDAITRSARTAKDARRPVGVVFALFVLLPTAATQTAAIVGWAEQIGYAWPAVLAVAEALTAVGTIALTRLFVILGGAPTPPFDQIAPQSHRDRAA